MILMPIGLALAPPEPVTKVVLTTHDLCPYGCYQRGSAHQPTENTFSGVAFDVVQCAFDKMNQPFDTLVVPWSRAQKLVENGKADGFFAASQQAHRDEFAVMSEIIAEQHWTWYLLTDTPLDPVSPDFKQLANVAAFSGSNMLTWMEQHDFQIIGRPRDTKDLLKMLLKKRVDAVMANNLVMGQLIAQQGLEDTVRSVTHLNKPLSVYFAKRFLKAHPYFLADFNHQVRLCRHNR